MNFFLKLLNEKSVLSSKRFLSLFCCFLLAITTIASLYGIKIQDSIIIALVAIITGSSTLTLFSQKKGDTTAPPSDSEKV